MNRVLLFCFISLAIGSAFVLESCQHEPFILIANTNGDDSTDTGGGDPDPDPDTLLTTIACDPDTVYFRNEILPLIVSNCSMSGCHDATSRKDGVILISYESIRATGDIKVSKPWDSKLYEVLVEKDAKERMPEGKPPLPNDYIAKILKWIEQGARDNYCDECDSTQSQYAAFIRPIIKNSCQGCHSGSSPGGGLDLSTYDGLKAVADNGRLVGAISHASSYKPMPPSGALPDCAIIKIREWVRVGAPNN